MYLSESKVWQLIFEIPCTRSIGVVYLSSLFFQVMWQQMSNKRYLRWGITQGFYVLFFRQTPETNIYKDTICLKKYRENNELCEDCKTDGEGTLRTNPIIPDTWGSRETCVEMRTQVNGSTWLQQTSIQTQGTRWPVPQREYGHRGRGYPRVIYTQRDKPLWIPIMDPK